MKRQAILTGVLAVIMIVTWNSWLFLDWKKANDPMSGMWQDAANSVVNSGESTEPKLWQAIKKTSVEETPDGEFQPTFDESVAAADGERVELPGVGFFLSSGLGENEKGEEEVTEFLLLPGHGGVAWCCGLTPIPNHEFSVLVDCSDAPFLGEKVDPKSPAFFVSVEGTLRLQRDNSINALYTLEDVAIEFIELKDVLPPNVMNVCLNKPMVP